MGGSARPGQMTQANVPRHAPVRNVNFQPDMAAPARRRRNATRRATPLIVFGRECRQGRRSFGKGSEGTAPSSPPRSFGHDTTTGDDGTCVPTHGCRTGGA